MTRILARHDLLALLDPDACVEALRDGFTRSPGAGTAAVPGQRVRTDLPFPGTATALIPGLLPGIDAYTVKVNAKFPGARPALRGVICLHSGHDGALLALLDSATVTAWRTGLGAALGTHLLAADTFDGPREGAVLGSGERAARAAATGDLGKPAEPAEPAESGKHGEGVVVGVVGAGAQAELMVLGLRRLRSVRALVVHDLDPARAAAFADRHSGHQVGSAAEVAERADIVLLATWSRTPLLRLADIRPGRHVTSLGADEPGKRELAGDLLEAALLVVDDRPLAAATGALAAAGLPAEAAHATLGEIMRGEHPGRTDPAQRTVYAPVGLPWQDLALSWLAYREAERRGAGVEVDLLG